MLFTCYLAFVVVASGIVYGQPWTGGENGRFVKSRPRALAQRQQGTGNVFMCTDPDYTGTCANMTVELGYNVCTTLSPPWIYNVSALQPQEGVACWLQR
ncbi:hypothetical protein BP5796_06709 [Coleophoma crateriformis]|uniref:Uncharacterized protein n=1 Tax=Coleophoma crateriformis TaxID=565419 RepID=A0A3D8RPK7_9HELO|nr:hypothetical protein BP5796_06709 [Coleophoma crateriformis]